MKLPAINLNRLNPRRGSASVLVIMLSLVMIVFGVFSMMTAHAGLAVARRHGDWNNKHHQVESKAAVIAAELYQLVEGKTAVVIDSIENETELAAFKDAFKETVEQDVAEREMPVTITWNGFSTETDEVVFQAEISLLPPPDERNGFLGVLQFRINLSEGEPSPMSVETIAWKSVTEAFEYRENIEFRDVEVEVQVE